MKTLTLKVTLRFEEDEVATDENWEEDVAQNLRGVLLDYITDNYDVSILSKKD